MEPFTQTLVGYPLSIFANFTYDQLKNVSQNIEINPLKDLFIKAFYKASKYHNKYYDDYSKEVIGKLVKAVKNDEDILLTIFSRESDNFNSFLSSIKSKEFQIKIAEEIINEYSLDFAKDKELAGSIVKDCLNYYLHAFFNRMNEKEGIQAILMECLKLNTIGELLKQIDSKVATKNDFDELQRIILFNYYKENEEAKKKLDDYDKYLKNKFKYLELRGFSPKISGRDVQMELLDVFVPLEIKIEQSIVPNIDEKIFLTQQSLETSSSKHNEGKKKDPLTSILEHRHLVILGDPGSGKSTLLKYLALQMIRSRNSEDLFANTVPLYVRISDYAEYFKMNKKTLYEFITEHYDKQYQHIFKENFEFSNLLLLIDGLDEITDTPLRIKVTEQVMDIIARYPFNRYVVTSRIVGYQESKLGGDFKHFKLMPVGLEEIKLFSNRWYTCIAQHSDEDYTHAAEQANSLYSSISRSPSVIRLATNPLLMTIIAMIHYKGKKLPNKRVELYDICTETFLEYWVQLRMCDESQLKDKNEMIEILAPIAYEIHQNKSNALIEEKEFEESFLLNFKNIHTSTLDEDAKRECKGFISFLRQQAGFFYEKGVDDEGNRFYGFIHLTFEEYLAAIELVSKWSEGGLNLKDYVFDPRWTEIIRLAASQLRLSYKGRAGRIQSTQFIKEILSVGDPFPEAYRPLQLVSLILSDDVNIMDEILNEILDEIIEALSKMDFKELTESFSELFKELLYSDYRNAFINRFEKEMITDNSILLNNLMHIFVSNSGDREINKILLSKFNENDNIFRATYKIKWQNFPFQNTKVYKDHFKNYLSGLVPHDNEEDLKDALENFIHMESGSRGGLWSWNMEKLIDTLNQFIGRELFDIYLTKILNHLLGMRFSGAFNEGLLDQFLQRNYDNVLAKNLNKSFNELNFDHIITEFGSSMSIIDFEIEDFTVALVLHDQKNLNVFMWPQLYDHIFHHSISVTDIPSYLKGLKSRFSESDIGIIENEIGIVFGPQNGADAENTSRFIDVYGSRQSTRVHYLWRLFPFINVNLNPSILSKIIVQNGGEYIKSSSYLFEFYELRDKKSILLKYFDNEHIRPPAKLLAYYILNEPFNRKLIEDSIIYYRDSSFEEKRGAFSILYAILNPFKFV